MTIDLTMNADLAAFKIPDRRLAREMAELVQDTESSLLIRHSGCVHCRSAAAGKRRSAWRG
jgi:hypothetical protein